MKPGGKSRLLYSSAASGRPGAAKLSRFINRKTSLNIMSTEDAVLLCFIMTPGSQKWNLLLMKTVRTMTNMRLTNHPTEPVFLFYFLRNYWDQQIDVGPSSVVHLSLRILTSCIWLCINWVGSNLPCLIMGFYHMVLFVSAKKDSDSPHSLMLFIACNNDIHT